MMRVAWILPLLLVLITSCRTSEEVFHRGEVLTYEQYQGLKIEDALTAGTVLDRYGRPKAIQEVDGRVRTMTYRCEDRIGKFRDLTLEFDENEVLKSKNL